MSANTLCPVCVFNVKGEYYSGTSSVSSHNDKRYLFEKFLLTLESEWDLVKYKETHPDAKHHAIFTDCLKCRKITWSTNALKTISSTHPASVLRILAGLARELTDMGNQLDIVNNAIEDVLSNPLIPRSPTEKMDKLLLWLHRNTEYFGQIVDIETLSICYALNDTECASIINAAINYGYLKRDDQIYLLDNFMAHIALTLQGNEYCQKLKQRGSNTNNVFVAMWFNTDVFSAYDEAIKPAIEECGYIPVRVDKKEHNNDITDEIVIGIKDSKFVIADMTGYRGGVYFEAGYAKGLGKEVILTCRKDWFKGEKDASGKTVKEAVHFDINHFNIIVWETLDELKKRIENRIRATIGGSENVSAVKP